MEKIDLQKVLWIYYLQQCYMHACMGLLVVAVVDRNGWLSLQFLVAILVAGCWIFYMDNKARILKSYWNRPESLSFTSMWCMQKCMHAYKKLSSTLWILICIVSLLYQSWWFQYGMCDLRLTSSIYACMNACMHLYACFSVCTGLSLSFWPRLILKNKRNLQKWLLEKKSKINGIPTCI